MTGMPSAFVRSQGFPEAGTVAECRLSALAAAAASRELQSWRDGRPAPMQCPGSSGISPFYRAAHARHLLGGAPSRSCYLDHCIEQVTPRSWSALEMAHLINPAAILQLEVGVEAEEIGRTDRVIGPCHFLASIDDIGKRQLFFLRQAFHVLKRVSRISPRVVRHDRNRSDAMRFQLPGVANDVV